MPLSPDIDFSALEEAAKKVITHFGADVGPIEKVPIAFGLQSLNIIIIMNENLGSTEELEKQLAQLDDVNSVDVIDVRRAIG